MCLGALSELLVHELSMKIVLVCDSSQTHYWDNPRLWLTIVCVCVCVCLWGQRGAFCYVLLRCLALFGVVVWMSFMMARLARKGHSCHSFHQWLTHNNNNNLHFFLFLLIDDVCVSNFGHQPANWPTKIHWHSPARSGQVTAGFIHTPDYCGWTDCAPDTYRETHTEWPSEQASGRVTPATNVT